MAAELSGIYRDSLLSAQRLRELIREARGGFAPDQVGLVLRHRTPEYHEEDAGEIAGLLQALAATARDRLNDAGLEPRRDEKPGATRLPKREREYVINLSAILTWLCHAENAMGDPALSGATAKEAIAWCRLAGDHSQETILWRLLALIQSELNELDDAESSSRSAIEAAHLAGNAAELALALASIASLFIVRFRLDEAEAANNEALAILKESMKEDGDRRHYPKALINAARINLYRAHYPEGIRILREALRWCDAESTPADRAAVLIHLGSVYLRLEHFRQSIECQHEVVSLADAAGSSLLRSWGYYRLAEAHLRLGELEQTREMLDRADQYAPKGSLVLILSIAAKRSQLLTTTGALEEAAASCRLIIEQLADHSIPDLEMFAHKTLAEIEERRGRSDESIAHFHDAIEIAERAFPERAPAIKVYLAELLHKHGRDQEVRKLLDESTGNEGLNPDERGRILHIEAAMAEARGDLRAALDLAREAFAVERTVLERQAERSLRNARIVAETDLLEREADLERGRRRRVERELAEAVVQLGDRKRIVETVEQKLRSALRDAGPGAGTGTHADHERSMARALRETLSEIRSQPASSASPLHYLNGVDEEFYQRLREICPGLTPKQERLCGLLRAGLASKDIATLLQLGAEGLKAQRKRLRKKLNLGAGERLETALAGI